MKLIRLLLNVLTMTLVFSHAARATEITLPFHTPQRVKMVAQAAREDQKRLEQDLFAQTGGSVNFTDLSRKLLSIEEAELLIEEDSAHLITQVAPIQDDINF